MKNFPESFTAHKCLNVMYSFHKFKNKGLQVICKQSKQEKNDLHLYLWKLRDFQGYFSMTVGFNFQDFPGN